MGLSVKEKEHWKERIAKRIRQAVDDLFASKAPNLHQEVADQARQRVLKQFDILELFNQAIELKQQLTTMEADRVGVIRQIEDRLNAQGHKVNVRYYDPIDGVNQFLESRTKALEQELLKATSVGKEAMRLQKEEEQILDTIWLATSSIQIQALWKNVGDMIGDKPTELQNRAFETPPTEPDRQ